MWVPLTVIYTEFEEMTTQAPYHGFHAHWKQSLMIDGTAPRSLNTDIGFFPELCNLTEYIFREISISILWRIIVNHSWVRWRVSKGDADKYNGYLLIFRQVSR
jgi:hypothetical protein